MWSALQSDLTEFVSTVRDESQTVLTTIDSTLASDERNQGSGGDAPDVIVGEDGEVTYLDQTSGFEATGIVSSAADEVARLRNLEETYSIPLIPDEQQKVDAAAVGDDASSLDEPEIDRVRQFLTEFDVSSKTEDIAAILETYPDTVKVHFENLVPTAVTYEQFWQRYHYRCDEERVQRTWDDDANKARIARQEAISSGIESVKSIFGGAVKALGGGSEAAPPSTDGSSTYEKYQAEIGQHRKKEGASAEGGLAATLFGKSGRPPFVMNTAVSDVDDSMENMSEEEDEEEELGWSDEDDEDEEEEQETEGEEDDGEESAQGSGADLSEEQIDFTSPDKDLVDELRTQVAQAEEERDQLHQTVEMQSKEIAQLQDEQRVGTASGATSDELQKLKMQLFEKDSEIAALRASLEDIHQEEGAMNEESVAKFVAVQNELIETKSTLAAKEDEIRRLIEASAKFQASADDSKLRLSAEEKSLESAKSHISQLQSELKNAKGTAANSGSEVVDLRLGLEQSATDAAAVDKDLASAKNEIQRLRSELEASSKTAEEAELRSKQLNLELAKFKAQKEEQELKCSTTPEEEISKVRAQQTVAPSSPAAEDELSNQSSSLSSAIKVPISPKHVPTPSPDEDNDDDWGDSWGDDDD